MRPFILLAIFLLTSCGPTTKEVINQYAPEYQKKREQFSQIAASLPPPETVTDGCIRRPDPTPIYDQPGDTFTMDVISAQNLMDPDLKIDSQELDLHLSQDMLQALHITGPKNDMFPSALKKNGKKWGKFLKKTLDYRYLLVNRADVYQAPRIIDAQTYERGYGVFSAFLIDLNQNEIVCSFKYTAQSSDSVGYAYKKDSGTELDRAFAFAKSSLYEDALKNLKEKYASVTRGQIITRN